MAEIIMPIGITIISSLSNRQEASSRGPSMLTARITFERGKRFHGGKIFCEGEEDCLAEAGTACDPESARTNKGRRGRRPLRGGT